MTSVPLSSASTAPQDALTSAQGRSGPLVVGVIGAGQLGRMMAAPATSLGIRLRLLAETADSAAAQVIRDTLVGDYTDPATVVAWAQGCDVITFDHEHVPSPVLEALRDAGIPFRPGSDALAHAQDKLLMRARLTQLGVPCPRWAQVLTLDELAEFAQGQAVVVKTPRGGYDGKGVAVVRTPTDPEADVRAWFDDAAEQVGGDGPLARGLLAEELVDFTRELAVLVARRPSGDLVTWPVVETVQTRGVCTQVIAPAPGLSPADFAEAARIGVTIAQGLQVSGVLAVEMFQVEGPDGSPAYQVNELAMRPHNSGHWTITGSITSQFEQHLRAVSDLPLGDPSPRHPWTVMSNVMGEEGTDLYAALPAVLSVPGASVEIYGKGARAGRKLGHVNVSGADLDETLALAQRAAALASAPPTGDTPGAEQPQSDGK